MGYNVRIIKSDVSLPVDKLNQIITIWKNINHHKFNHLKRGGNDKIKYYSFMDVDYHLHCDRVEEVLDHLEFGWDFNKFGGVDILSFDGKTGQEEEFFVAIAHLIPRSSIEWIGEDNTLFTWYFDGKTLNGYDNPFLANINVKLIQENIYD